MTASQLATRLHVSKGYLSKVERGTARPSEAMVARMARTLRTDPAPIYQLSGYVPPDIGRAICEHPDQVGALLDAAGNEFQFDVAPDEDRAVKDKPRGLYELVHGDCFEWMEQRAPNSIHAIVTDPPYGLREYTEEEKGKLRNGNGGIWRIPPSFDGCERSPLPRFTVLTDSDRSALREFFSVWAVRALRVLVPGAHVFVATNPLVSHIVYVALLEAGFEKRGEIIRLVQTLRGGDRPKNAHREFADVTVMPRSCWEPWGLFRKPCHGRVQDNLRRWKTGGLRRISEEQPFFDVIRSSPTRASEREIAPHPSLKPQALMRQLVRASLPLGEGIVLDPFMGAGSTIAAACALGYDSIGIELDELFYGIAIEAIPRLAALRIYSAAARPPSSETRRRVVESQETLFDK